MSYDDVIGYDEAKKCLRRVLGSYGDPILAQKLKKFNVAVPGGVLLHGPPGNSKTVLVMAAANSHGLPVIAVSSADIYSVFVGEPTRLSFLKCNLCYDESLVDLNQTLT